MADNARVAVGVLVIVIAIILWITALPTLSNNIGTATGQPMENATGVVKAFLGYYDIIFAIMIFILIGFGLTTAAKGL